MAAELQSNAKFAPEPLNRAIRDRLIESAEGVLASARALASETDPASEPWAAEGTARLVATAEGLYLDALELP